MSQLVPYGAVIYAKDYRALASFYEHVAGLTQREADEEYVLLEAPFFQLVILQIVGNDHNGLRQDDTGHQGSIHAVLPA